MTDWLTRPESPRARDAARYRAMEDAPASPWASSWSAPAPEPAAPAARFDWRRFRRNALFTLPVLGLNVGAAYGQQLWAAEHIPGGPVVAWAFAAVVESVALFLAAEAHEALMAGDAAIGRRVSSYTVAAAVGWLNWSHWSAVNVEAGAVYAAASVLSPWLWAIRSKSMRRAELRAAGLVDARLPRFAVAKWVLHAVPTFRMWRWAAWENVSDPAAARAGWEASRAADVDPDEDDEAEAAPAPVALPAAPVEAAAMVGQPAPVARPAARVRPRKAAPGRNAGAAEKARRAVESFTAEHKRAPSVSELKALGVSEGTARRVLS